MKLIAIALLTICLLPCAVRSSLLGGLLGGGTERDSGENCGGGLLGGLLDGVGNTVSDLLGDVGNILGIPIDLLKCLFGSSDSQDWPKFIKSFEEFCYKIETKWVYSRKSCLAIIKILLKVIENILNSKDCSQSVIKDFVRILLRIVKKLLTCNLSMPIRELLEKICIELRVWLWEMKMGSHTMGENEVRNKLGKVKSLFEQILTVNSSEDSSYTNTKNNSEISIGWWCNILSQLEESVKDDKPTVSIVVIIQKIQNMFFAFMAKTQSNEDKTKWEALINVLETALEKLSSEKCSLKEIILEILEGVSDQSKTVSESGSDSSLIQIICNIFYGKYLSMKDDSKSVIGTCIAEVFQCLINTDYAIVMRQDTSNIKKSFDELKDKFMILLPQIKNNKSFDAFLKILTPLISRNGSNSDLGQLSTLISDTMSKFERIIGERKCNKYLLQFIDQYMQRIKAGGFTTSGYKTNLEQMVLLLKSFESNSDGKYSKIIQSLRLKIEQLSTGDVSEKSSIGFLQNIKIDISSALGGKSTATPNTIGNTTTPDPITASNSTGVTVTVPTTKGTGGSNETIESVKLCLQNLVDIQKNLQKSKNIDDKNAFKPNLKPIYIIFEKFLSQKQDQNGKLYELIASICPKIKEMLNNSLSPDDLKNGLMKLSDQIKIYDNTTGSPEKNDVPTTQNNTQIDDFEGFFSLLNGSLKQIKKGNQNPKEIALKLFNILSGNSSKTKNEKLRKYIFEFRAQMEQLLSKNTITIKQIIAFIENQKTIAQKYTKSSKSAGSSEENDVPIAQNDTQKESSVKSQIMQNIGGNITLYSNGDKISGLSSCINELLKYLKTYGTKNCGDLLKTFLAYLKQCQSQIPKDSPVFKCISMCDEFFEQAIKAGDAKTIIEYIDKAYTTAKNFESLSDTEQTIRWSASLPSQTSSNKAAGESKND